jgi:hypothetical protein
MGDEELSPRSKIPISLDYDEDKGKYDNLLLKDLNMCLEKFDLGEIFTDIDAIETSICENNLLIEAAHLSDKNA